MINNRYSKTWDALDEGMLYFDLKGACYTSFSRVDPAALTDMIKPIESKGLLIWIVAATAGTKFGNFALSRSTTWPFKISM